jgi:peptide methionine sulfoxide reductase msrA/msrB
MIKTASLSPEILHIVRDKGTEAPFSYNADVQITQAGTYLCRQCGLGLFRTDMQFPSGCGWPSFDNELSGAVVEKPDADGRRTEILCARCNAHLGHVFYGEKFTSRNMRHCVNGLSLEFVGDSDILDTEEAIVAGGCFWGVEYYFAKLEGVLKTEVGYIGGSVSHPNYQSICEGNTGHLEAIRVIYDPKKLSYAALIQYFLEIHDPTQSNGQGPDLGEQYHSAIFYYDATQEAIANQYCDILRNKSYKIATTIRPVSIFWPAEKYHQQYYAAKKALPYCHHYVQRF